MKCIIIALLFICTACVPCSDLHAEYEFIQVHSLHDDVNEHVRVYEVRGHEYLFIKSGNGLGICHLESCQCKKESRAR